MTRARLAMVHFYLRHNTTLASVLPCAIYTIPEVLMAGATKESLVPEGVDYVAARASYEKNGSGQIIGEGGGLLSLLFSRPDLSLDPPNNHGCSSRASA